MARPTSTSSLRRGVSMAEIVMATAIVGIMIVAALESAGMVYRTRRMNIERLTGPGLARELLTEVMSHSYKDPDGSGDLLGIDSGELLPTRTDFDDIDDYHGYSSNDARAKDGSLLPGYANWRQQVSVSWANLADATGGAATGTGLKRITVTITSPQGKLTQISGLRSNEGVLEQSLPLETQAVAWIGAQLRLGASSRAERAAALITNHADDVN